LGASAVTSISERYISSWMRFSLARIPSTQCSVNEPACDVREQL
jgi:hypothetical protein